MPGRWSSIERQLPLLIMALLVPIVLMLIGCVYTEVRTQLGLAASARLEGSAREAAALLEEGSRRSRRLLRATAQAQWLLDWMQAPSEAREKEVRERLVRWFGQRDGVAEIWSAAGERLLRIPSPVAAGKPVPAVQNPDLPPPTSTGHQPLKLAEGRPYHEMAAEIRDRDPDTLLPLPPIGRLVMRRNFVGGQGAELLGRLIGTNTSLRLGNRDGSLWTDIDERVPPPPVDPLDREQHLFHDAGGVLRVGAGFVLAETPWVLWVETDAAEALAPAGHLLWVLVLVGGGLLLAGFFGAFAISRRIARPLREATEAAEAIAAGDYGRRLLLRRRDEVGRLTLAFNSMAAEVEDAHAQQERLVARRTADLSAALQQLRAAQADLVRKEKLALMGQLAGSVGHELRNPLGVMSNGISCLELMLDGAGDGVQSQLGMLRRQVGQSQKIIDDLLDFTRHKPPVAGPVDLPQLAREQFARLSAPDVRLDVRVPACLPAAWADATQIGQVLLNLMTNAVQAMHGAGGTVHVRLQAIGDRIRLEITDEGPGVDGELRDRIFEPLFTTRSRGIGLGLWVSRWLAQGNGGDLSLAPPGERTGATFVLELPAQRR